IGTPDAWIPRDPRMVRLTGKHPFNAEAKLKDLFAQGFLTPSNLFFVRNHGAVPKIDRQMANEWKLKVHGLCARPTTFTLDDLRTKFRVVTIPVTLVCAGNRRKEQNVVQKSLGFSWGAAGLSTALFTGVYLADILEYILPERSARHVVFEGSDDLPNGPYGTASRSRIVSSQLLSWARDKRKGMMLAWGMNGLPLEPDHGFPLRLVVPSQIGGRSVKWLSRIELSEQESQHHLHFRDNKVLPMPVGPGQARAEDHWWYDRRYIIRDLNTNSAIACPDHDEILDTSAQGADGTYQVKGYAYAGGGRRVTRVEISSDDGETWSLADITYPEDLFRTVAHFDPVYGDLDMTESDTCFCWCFWSFEMSIKTIETSRAIVVRCMDESLALQPRNMYWNATGMMNNWWFRVCIHQLGDGRVRFEHPTMAGIQPGGWMQRLKDEGLDPAKPDFSASASPTIPAARTLVKVDEVQMIRPDVNRKISIAELESAEAKEDAWFVVRGEVYKGSGFFDEHPGGAQSIILVAGEDATEDFMAIHSSDAKKKLAGFHIGTLDGAISTKVESDTEVSGSFLDPKKWQKVFLVSVTDVSKDTKIYRFALGNQEQELGLPFGQHVYVRLYRKVTGELVQRAYTPLSERSAKGFVDILVKIYYPTLAFPLGGRMTLGFSELLVGDTVELKGPVGHFIWKGEGIAMLHGEEKHVREIGLVCGGSGITPILQVLRAILTDPLDNDTKVWVVDVNRQFEDILCREELERLASQQKRRLRLHFSLTGTPLPDNWLHSVGRITKEMLKIHLPEPSNDKLVCICGPGPMEQSTKGEVFSRQE
ncbi:Nitrate reductase [NADPH], partial [Leucoagaricus sp. SymC.cos]